MAGILPSHNFAFSNGVTNKADKEESDETLLNLGEAIRSGNEENVIKIIGANSIRIESLLSKIGIMFETYLRRKDIAKDSEKNLCSDPKKKKLDEMFVSPFQLAILAQQSKVRYHSRFFVQPGHETTCASSVNKHFFTISCQRQTYQNYEESRQKLSTILENKGL